MRDRTGGTGPGGRLARYLPIRRFRRSTALSGSAWLGIMSRFHFSRLGAPAMLRISQEALTFDDVLLIPGYSEVLPKDVSLKNSPDPRHRTEHPAGIRRDGYRDRSPPGHRHGPGRRHRHHPQEHGHRAAGRGSPQGQEARDGHRPRPGHRDPLDQDHRTAADGPRVRLLRLPGGGAGRAGRYRHRSRPAGEAERRRYRRRDHDPEGQAGHRPRRHPAGRDEGQALREPHREDAGSRRELLPAWPGDLP
ncbi:inosine 5'-monophosphate dehydrogenase [Pseudomonas aeruginosa]|nr:inosine 5'-monophosphate dehydrogenase [Pseudomonas aeruginosa]